MMLEMTISEGNTLLAAIDCFLEYITTSYKPKDDQTIKIIIAEARLLQRRLKALKTFVEATERGD